MAAELRGASSGFSFWSHDVGGFSATTTPAAASPKPGCGRERPAAFRYTNLRHPTVACPKKELKGFQRCTLRPQETKTVQLTLPAKTLRYWHVGRQNGC